MEDFHQAILEYWKRKVPQEIVWLAWTNKKINQKKKVSTSCCVGAGVDVLMLQQLSIV